MSSKSNAPVIVIFGITGDLSQRKLLPALYQLLTHGLLDADTRIIGTSRREISPEELLDKVELCVLEKEKVCDPEGLAKIRQALHIVQLDPTSPQDFKMLAQSLNALDEAGKRERIFYMAIPPNAYVPIISQLGTHELNDDRTRLLVEKPFGHDGQSAKQLIEATNEHFDESQIYRIDHYLAKETAQNLLAFRLHNPIFAPLWNGDHIEKVHIRAAEAIGIENRIDFYEQTGALRDLIQSHLLQLLAIVMMDQPSEHESEHIHEGKEAFLRSVAVADPALAVRAQYEGYASEVKNPHSHTETYAKIELKSELARWQDTRIVLETGKALDQKMTEVIIQFKHQHESRKNQLRFRLQPNEGISLDLVVKVPGFDDQMQHTNLEFSYKDVFPTGGAHPDAYERVIIDAINADQSLFASSQELISSWHIVDRVLEKWATSSQPIQMYPKGSKRP